jgi:hypothetical protein
MAGVVVYEPDLFFSSKIQSLVKGLAVPASVVTDINELKRKLAENSPRLIILNLDALEGSLASLEGVFTDKPGLLIGYYSHTNRKLAEEAKKSGGWCTHATW